MPALHDHAAASCFRQLEVFSGARPVGALRSTLQAHYTAITSPGEPQAASLSLDRQWQLLYGTRPVAAQGFCSLSPPHCRFLSGLAP